MVVEEHASLVRHLCECYLALGTVRLLHEELSRQGVTLPIRQRLSGSAIGGGPFSRGQLYKILSNPIYIGRIPHRTQSYPGLHPAIVGTKLWDQIQAKLADNRQGSRTRARAASPSLLAGKLVDGHGTRLTATHASKAGRRYRYYVGQQPGLRIPALEIEAAVCQRLATAFDDPFAIAGSAGLALAAATTAGVAQHAHEAAAMLRKRHRPTILALVEQVRLHSSRIEIDCGTTAVAAVLGGSASPDAPPTLTLTSELTLTRSGRALRLVQGDGTAAAPATSPALVRLLVRARRWGQTLRKGELDVTRLAAREGVQPAYVTRVLRLAFLSPEVIGAIVAGSTPVQVNTMTLTAPDAIPQCRQEQVRRMLPASVGSRINGTW